MSQVEWRGIQKFLISVAGGICLAMVMQTGGLIWWASAINCRVGRAELDLSVMCERVRVIEIEAARERHMTAGEKGVKR